MGRSVTIDSLTIEKYDGEPEMDGVAIKVRNGNDFTVWIGDSEALFRALAVVLNKIIEVEEVS